jgi:hypothetical protein
MGEWKVNRRTNKDKIKGDKNKREETIKKKIKYSKEKTYCISKIEEKGHNEKKLRKTEQMERKEKEFKH